MKNFIFGACAFTSLASFLPFESFAQQQATQNSSAVAAVNNPTSIEKAAPILDTELREQDSIKEVKEPARKEEDHEGVFTFSLENDLFNGSDDGYTNGVRFAFVSAENNIPSWIENSANAMPFFASEGHKRWTFAAGQSMFAPSDITLATRQPDDRPYAGFLYGTLGLLSDTGSRLDNLQLTLGVVGPSSLAEQSQKIVHHIVDSPQPRGWDYQLKDEPAAMISYNRKWRGLYEFSPFGYGFDITPSAGANLGNVFTNATVGSVVRFGYDLPADYGPPLIQPTSAGSDFFIPRKDFGWYLFAGVEGRAVARNIFLDGNTFRDSQSVDKYPLVGDLQGGIAFTFSDVRIAYTQIWRTKEFENQPDGDNYGALTISTRF